METRPKKTEGNPTVLTQVQEMTTHAREDNTREDTTRQEIRMNTRPKKTVGNPTVLT